jgi:hypothetical protein
MSKHTAAKIKITRNCPGHYIASVNGVPCFDIFCNDGDGYVRWDVSTLNPYCDWGHAENRKKDAVEFIEFYVATEGADRIIEISAEREWTWEGSIDWDRNYGW